MIRLLLFFKKILFLPRPIIDMILLYTNNDKFICHHLKIPYTEDKLIIIKGQSIFKNIIFENNINYFRGKLYFNLCCRNNRFDLIEEEYNWDKGLYYYSKSGDESHLDEIFLKLNYNFSICFRNKKLSNSFLEKIYNLIISKKYDANNYFYRLVRVDNYNFINSIIHMIYKINIIKGLKVACRYCSIEVVKLLFDKCKINSNDLMVIASLNKDDDVFYFIHEKCEYYSYKYIFRITIYLNNLPRLKFIANKLSLKYYNVLYEDLEENNRLSIFSMLNFNADNVVDFLGDYNRTIMIQFIILYCDHIILNKYRAFLTKELLVYCCNHGTPDMIKIFIDCGIYPDNFCLKTAIHSKKYDIIKLIIPYIDEINKIETDCIYIEDLIKKYI